MAHLRTVQPGETPGPETPKTISEAVESGSSRDVLATMRRSLAKKLDDGDISSNAIASACTKLQELDRLIRQIDADRAEEEAKKRADDGRNRRSFNAAAL